MKIIIIHFHQFLEMIFRKYCNIQNSLGRINLIKGEFQLTAGSPEMSTWLAPFSTAAFTTASPYRRYWKLQFYLHSNPLVRIFSSTRNTSRTTCLVMLIASIARLRANFMTPGIRKITIFGHSNKQPRINQANKLSGMGRKPDSPSTISFFCNPFPILAFYVCWSNCLFQRE